MSSVSMRVVALAIGLTLLSAPPGGAEDPSASGHPLTGRWQGAAAETPSIYLGPVSATVTLDLKPDGTFMERWKQGGREWSQAGRWHLRGKTVVLEAHRSHPRMTLRRAGDTLYTVATEPMPDGRATTTTIALHPVAP